MAQTGLDVQIRVEWFEEAGPLPCPAPKNEEVQVRFLTLSAKEAADKPPEQLDQIFASGQAKQVSLDELNAISGSVRIANADVTRAQSVSLPLGQAEQIDIQNIDLNRSDLYSVFKVTLITSAARKTIQVDLIEQFVRLGDLQFEPQASDGTFEPNCGKVQLVVVQNAELNWPTFTAATESRPSHDSIRLFAREANYSVDPSLENLAIAWPSQAQGQVRVFIDETDIGKCHLKAEDARLSRQAFTGQVPRPIVRDLPPSLYIVGTRNQKMLDALHVPVGTESHFWTDFVGELGSFDRQDSGQSQFAQSVFAMREQDKSSTPIRSDKGAPLVPDDRAAISMADKLLSNSSSPDQVGFLFMDPGNLSAAIIEMMGRPAGTGAPDSAPKDARIIIVGPRLGLSGPVCEDLRHKDGSELADWLRSGAARVVSIEFGRLPQQVAVANRDAPEGVYECRTSEIWKDVLRSFVIAPDSLVEVARKEALKYIFQQAKIFFQLRGSHV